MQGIYEMSIKVAKGVYLESTFIADSADIEVLISSKIEVYFDQTLSDWDIEPQIRVGLLRIYKRNINLVSQNKSDIEKFNPRGCNPFCYPPNYDNLKGLGIDYSLRDEWCVQDVVDLLRHKAGERVSDI